MTKNGYMTRAMRRQDPRFAKILGKLGYESADMQADKQADDVPALRAQYTSLCGKRPFMGWDAATLKSKIEELAK